jgi:UDP-N-acetylmuramoyl-L-alanyl-D-glutamate--2,6-diaminopimelate ligase
MRLGELMDGMVEGLSDRPLLAIRGVLASVPGDLAHTRICDLTEDSRTVVPGSLFIARGGRKADGKQFVSQALRAGAVAILTDDASLELPEKGEGVPVLIAPDVALVSALLAERFYGRPSNSMDLVGVTGTNGKTTVTSLVWQLLNACSRRCGLIGTVIVDDGVEVAPASMTTPPAIELSRSLARMLECGCKAAALEVSSHALDQRRADALRFRVGVFTNLSGDHLDYHQTMDAYAGAKARLFEALAQDATAIVNDADPRSARILRDCKARVVRARVVREGELAGGAWGPNSDQCADQCAVAILAQSASGMDLALAGAWGVVRGRVGLVGAYNAMNVLQAVASVHALGLRAQGGDGWARALPSLVAPPGRLERVEVGPDQPTVFVDYAHSDDSLRNALRAVRGVMDGASRPPARIEAAAGAVEVARRGGDLWVVFGCGGDRDRTKRPRMGLAAAQLADRVVVTSDNPRTERPSDVIDEVLAGIPANLRGKVTIQADRARAIRFALEQAHGGDVVLIAGKGHETEQVLPDGQGGTIRTHFDDREVARAALEELLGEARPAERA